VEPCAAVCRGLILLETYTANASPDFIYKLPPFLKILREVTGDPAFSMYNLCLMDEYRQNGVAGGSRSEGALDARRRIKSENSISGTNGAETGNDANGLTASQSRLRHFSGQPMSASSASLDEDEDDDDDDDDDNDERDIPIDDHRRGKKSPDDVSLQIGSPIDADKDILRSIENRVSKEGPMAPPFEPFHPSDTLNGSGPEPFPPAAPYSSPSGVAKRLLARSLQRSASLPPNADSARKGNAKLNGSRQSELD